MVPRGRNPFKELFYTIMTASLIVLAAYVFYKGVIVGDLLENNKVISVFSNTISWGLGLGKDIGDAITRFMTGS